MFIYHGLSLCLSSQHIGNVEMQGTADFDDESSEFEFRRVPTSSDLRLPSHLRQFFERHQRPQVDGSGHDHRESQRITENQKSGDNGEIKSFDKLNLSKTGMQALQLWLSQLLSFVSL